jgi:PAS domain S-box-containing protein
MKQRRDDAAASTRRVLIATGVMVVVFVVLAMVAMVIVTREARSARAAQVDVFRAWETLEQVQTVLSTLKDAETAERGYVITGNAEFLEPYERARQSLSTQLERLESLMQGESQRSILQQLSTLVHEELDLLRRSIELHDSEGARAAADFVRSGVGKEKMDEVRALVRQLSGDEREQLVERRGIYQRRSSGAEFLVQVFLVSAALLILTSGALLIRHIGQRMRAERDATRAVTQLRAIMENLAQGVCVFDADMRLVAWNSTYLEMRGLDPQLAYVGMTMAELKEKAASLKMVMAEGLREMKTTMPTPEEKVHGFDAEALRDDGTVLRVRGRPMPDGNFIITYTDITQLKLSEAAFRDQATRLAAILDNAVDAIVTINESGSIESWSKSAERLFGYQEHEVVRRNVRMLMPEPYSSAHDGYIRHYLETGERRIIGMRREVEALHKDGHRIPVDLGISEMHIGDRRLFIGIVRDISVRHEIERLKSGFVSTVSHELRTPLTSISGSLGLLSGGVAGQLPPKAQRLIEIAKLNSDRLVRLINDILDLEKAESGKLEFQLQPLRLKPLVEQAIELNRNFAQTFGVVIELDPDSDDAIVLVDRDRLIQVITNLLSNAAKFSPRGGYVKVDIELDRDDVRISVHDRGSGIPDSFRARIFERFAQADSSDSRAKGGTGLGLSICKTIVGRLGGSIGFHSVHGQGSTFYVTLPIREDLSLDACSAEELAAASVLVCEDDPDIAEILVETLRHEGIRAEAVPTAQAAKATLEQAQFDVAIVDLNLPDADGLELITELRAREATRALPVIVATARSKDARDTARLGMLQIADWLQKPIDPQRLLNSIQGALARSRTERASILHVEDDVSLTALVRELLEGEARLSVAHSLAQARELVGGYEYDLIILDVALQDGSGLDVLPVLRESGRRVPPVILYSASEASHEVASMVQAALVKSRDSIGQLLAQVRALARRGGPAATRSVAD